MMENEGICLADRNTCQETGVGIYGEEIHTCQDSRSGTSGSICRIMTKATHQVDYPLDKVNSIVWGRIADFGEGGQLIFGMEKRGSKQEANVALKIAPSDLALSAYDKRVYIAVSALFNSGNQIITASQIYAKMGSSGRPNQSIIKKINRSLAKMRQSDLSLNNEDEIEINKRYRLFDYNGSLLPFTYVPAYINNTYCDSVLYLAREPPLISFARERKQITTIPLVVLESNIPKTEQNLRIEDYLIARIAHMRNPKNTRKILLETVFQKCGLSEKKQRQRAIAKIEMYLNHYQSTGLIRNYTFGSNCILIHL